MQAGNNFRHEKINASYFHFFTHDMPSSSRYGFSFTTESCERSALFGEEFYRCDARILYCIINWPGAAFLGNYHRIYCFPNLRRSIAKQKFVSSGGNGNWRWHDGINCTHVREFPRILQRDTGRLDYILPLFVLAGTYAPGLWFCPCWLHCESDWLPCCIRPWRDF